MLHLAELKCFCRLLEDSPYISNIQQVLSHQTMKCIVMYCQTEQFFIGKSDRSNIFQELFFCLQEIPDVKVRTAEDLLRNPARRIITRCFNNLWQQGTKYGLNVTESDAEIPCWSVPELQGMTFKCWSKLVLICLYTACMKNNILGLTSEICESPVNTE